MSTTLRIKGLTKKFGRITAVNNLDLSIESGQVFGILGPNGSGKTTTLGMLLDVITPTDGDYEWFGGLAKTESRKKIGSILETPCFYPYLSAVQNLRIIAHIKDCSYNRIDKVLEDVNLTERKNDKFKTYSLGMKQRLSIAAALLSDPPILILDEPTNGLDPEGIAEVRDLIKDIADKGKTILLASHLLDEVQKVCTDFCILKNGKKLHEGKVEDILGETKSVVISADDNEKLFELMDSFDGISNITKEAKELTVVLKEKTTSSDLNSYCHNHGISLKKLNPIYKSLEKEFLKILKEENQ